MTAAFTRSRHTARCWGLACSAILTLAACSDQSTAPRDSTPVTDSLNPALPADSVLGPDSLPTTTPPDSTAVPPPSAPTDTMPSPGALRPGIPYGPYNLMNGYTTFAWGPMPFTASLNGNTFAEGLVSQIEAARASNHRLMLSLTDGSMEKNKTGGKFDLAKWKRRMDRYNTPEIKAAVGRGLADGTIIGNQVLNEPMRPGWGGVFDKALLDQMCRYAKDMFPGVPAGPIVVHWWRMDEQFKVCDFIIDQYAWDQPPLGWGTPGGGGDVAAWRDAALDQARKQGITIAFSMNVLAGGPRFLGGCPVPKTGGRYAPYPQYCRMNPDQVREIGLTLGPAGCALFLWMYDPSFVAKAANVAAVDEVAAKLAVSPNRSCNRTG
ncbi:MAG: hypothetical protein ABI703_05225 [Gemmatimonadales bacterium]